MRVRSRVAPVVSYTAFSPLPPRGGEQNLAYSPRGAVEIFSHKEHKDHKEMIIF